MWIIRYRQGFLEQALPSRTILKQFTDHRGITLHRHKPQGWNMAAILYRLKYTTVSRKWRIASTGTIVGIWPAYLPDDVVTTEGQYFGLTWHPKGGTLGTVSTVGRPFQEHSATYCHGQVSQMTMYNPLIHGGSHTMGKVLLPQWVSCSYLNYFIRKPP